MTTPGPFVKDINTANFPQGVLQRSREVPVVVDFWAAWCEPCKILGPILEKVAAEAGGAFELVKVDVDSNQELSAQYGVQGIPMVVAFRDGKVVDSFIGAKPEAEVRAFVSALATSPGDRQVAELVAAWDENSLLAALELDNDNEAVLVALAELLVERGDTDGDGRINMDEFAGEALLFKRMDVNGDEFITKKELVDDMIPILRAEGKIHDDL